MLFFSREQVELVLISILVLLDSRPSPGEWLPRQIRHQVSEIKHIILFFHNGELSGKKKKSPIRLLSTLCPVSFSPRGLQFKSKMSNWKPGVTQLFLSPINCLGVGLGGVGQG